MELVVEVSDSSLTTDRYKAQIYAAAGIPHYWIINLIDRVVEVHAQPDMSRSPARYANIQRYTVGDKIPVVIGGQELRTVAVADLLP